MKIEEAGEELERERERERESRAVGKTLWSPRTRG